MREISRSVADSATVPSGYDPPPLPGPHLTHSGHAIVLRHPASELPHDHGRDGVVEGPGVRPRQAAHQLVGGARRKRCGRCYLVRMSLLARVMRSRYSSSRWRMVTSRSPAKSVTLSTVRRARRRMPSGSDRDGGAGGASATVTP